MPIAEEIRRLFPKRAADSHKGTYGTALTVCGSEGMAGACILSAKAALRLGVGLVACAVPRNIYPIVAGAVPEAVFSLDDDEAYLKKATAVLIGCGLGNDDNAHRRVAAVLSRCRVPVVVDADGINALSQHILSVEETEGLPLLLTPHPAELARLLACSVADVQQDRDAAAVEAARRYRAVVVLKGHHTVIADKDGVFYRNQTGNPGLATAGSGDVLAGMIVSLLAQGFSLHDAAKCGVYLHGLAGDRAAARVSQHGLIATDIISEIPALFLEIEA